MTKDSLIILLIIDMSVTIFLINNNILFKINLDMSSGYIINHNYFIVISIYLVFIEEFKNCKLN